MVKRSNRQSTSTLESLVDGISEQVEEHEEPAIAIGEKCAPLFAALENGVLQQQQDDNDDDDDEDVVLQNGLLSTRPLVNLFSKVVDRNGFVKAIQSNKFQKRHARRLFSAIHPLLQNVIENETYVPRSALESDDDEEEGEDGNDSVVTDHQVVSKTTKSKRTSDISQATANANAANTSDLEVTPDPESTQALHFMKYCAMMVQAYLENVTSRTKRSSSRGGDIEMQEEVLAVAELLHDELFSLISCGTEGAVVQRTVAVMCEVYWNGSFVDKELLVVQLVPYLVLKTLDGKATRADIKRFWNVRLALDLIDFDDDSIAHLKSLLLRTVSSPLYLKHAEGKKMIAFLFQLNTGLVKDLHRSIRVQIPLAKGNILKAYGDIYFAAWKDSLDDEDDSERDANDDESRISSIQSTIEEHVLQDLMYASLHIASANMAKSIRTILEPIHSNKKNPDVDQLLYRMYGPILWRSLAAPNPLVRINASSILSVTFPLHDPNAGKIHLKEMNAKSIESLRNLLNDQDPKVRVAGCDATIKILGLYWDALCSTDIRALLNDIIMKHTSDISSVAVRVQAVHGIGMLLDAETSHGVLRPLLPTIGNLIHDSQERVRLATVRLLLKLKKLRGFKYYHVVPSNHLLARLTAEAERTKSMISPVASSLTELLSNSYFPLGAKGSEQIRRTLVFLNKNPQSAKVFYANLPYHLDLNNVSKLVVMLIKILKLSVEKETSDEQNVTTSGSTDEMDISASNTTLMAEVAETINSLWTSISTSLRDPGNEDCMGFVLEAISDTTIVDLCLHFEDKIKKIVDCNEDKTVEECNRICVALLHCAGNLDPDNVRGFSSLLSSRIQSMNGKIGEGTEKFMVSMMTSHIAVLCIWGMSEDVALSLSCYISNEFEANDDLISEEDYQSDGDPDETNTVRNKKRKASKIDQEVNMNCSDIIPPLSGKVATKILGELLLGASQSSLIARERILSSEIACSHVESSLQKATVVAEMILAGSERVNFEKMETVLYALETYGRFSLHKEATKEDYISLSSQARSLLDWITTRAMPALLATTSARQEADPSPFRDLNLSRISFVETHDTGSPTPLSLLPVPPPRRRTKLGRLSSNLDDSFMNMESQGGDQYILNGGIPRTVNSQIFGICLIRSALYVFSEWAVIEGQGFSEIVEHALKWATIMQHKFDDFDPTIELLPVFSHLARIVGKMDSEYRLIREVILVSKHLNSEDRIVGILKKTLSSILSPRGQQKQKSNTESLVNMLCDLIGQTTASLGESQEEVLLEHNGLMIALECVLKNGPASSALASILCNKVLSKPNVSQKDGFDHCAFLLLICTHFKGQYNSEFERTIHQQFSDNSDEEIDSRDKINIILKEVSQC